MLVRSRICSSFCCAPMPSTWAIIDLFCLFSFERISVSSCCLVVNIMHSRLKTMLSSTRIYDDLQVVMNIPNLGYSINFHFNCEFGFSFKWINNMLDLKHVFMFYNSILSSIDIRLFYFELTTIISDQVGTTFVAYFVWAVVFVILSKVIISTEHLGSTVTVSYWPEVSYLSLEV